MKRNPINTIEEFKKIFLHTYRIEKNSLSNNVPGYDINFPLSLPIEKNFVEKQENPGESNDAYFESCYFNKGLTIRTCSDNLTFVDCHFNNKLNLKEVTLSGKVRFKECHFHETIFNNTTFEDLADFWRSTFHQKTIFYKVDFIGTVVFSTATFKKNVLFTYTWIKKLIIFRGTKVKKGLDLSLAILEGSLSVFHLTVKNFRSIAKYLDEEAYEQAVSIDGTIPIKNKRETFRILKKYHENQNNIVESLSFKVLEKRTLSVESLRNLIRIKKGENSLITYFLGKIKSFFNLIVLFFNWVSNYFGIAYIQSAIFTLIIGAIFFYLSMISTDKYEYVRDIDWNILKENIPAYANFLLPTHKFDYLGKGFELSNCFYLFDILGRIAVGYGIYQTIQAFRKFR